MRRVRRALSVAVPALAVSLAFACSDYGGVSYAPPPAPVSDASFVEAAADGSVVIVGVGEACDATRICRGGLSCEAGTCEPGRRTENGSTCTLSSECKLGSYCGPARTCTPAGLGQEASSCRHDGDCASGLRCLLVGLTAECRREGRGDVNGPCITSADCLGGLTCTQRACKALPVSSTSTAPLAMPTWQGEVCEDEAGPTRAYFRVPRGANDGDFYRLPFPSDVRLLGGRVQLTGHPTPGTEVLGFDLVDRYLRYLEATAIGFSPYSTITLRFSAPVDFETLKIAGAMRLVDLTPGMNGVEVSFGWSATSGRNAYLCPNALRVRPRIGAPLAAGHTYGLVVSSAVKDATGKDITQSADLAALLATAPPAENALANAHIVFKPLRDWATAKNVAAGTVLNATVFSVGRPAALASKLATAVAAAPAPTVRGWVKCGGLAPSPSPCPQATFDRACGTGDPLFDEYHALATLPRFQKGGAPYEAFGTGDLELASDGTPQVTGTDEVCLALTVPKAVTMPVGGWPLVVYAHGTGGSFRSHIVEGIAGRLSAIVDGATPIRAAVLGIDQVAHGTRRGASLEPPQKLFFNFANPGAARGNPLQGAADQMALVRLARSVNLDAATSPTGSALRFGTIAFWGHSQGATEGAIALPYMSTAAGVAGAVLSGEAASLLDTLVTKKSPVNLADVVPFALSDPSVDAAHPVLTLLQHALDPADPLNHAAGLAAAPIAAGLAKHVFMPYGQGDTFTPSVPQATFAIAAGLGLASHPTSVSAPEPIGSITTTAVPCASNYVDGTKAISAFTRQYAAVGYDGHFVATREVDAVKDVDRFLADVLAGRTPRPGR